MEITEVKQDIKNKTIKPMYVFTGEELGIMDIYIDKIAETLGCKIQRPDSIVSIMQKLGTKSFVQARNCYVIRDDMDFLKQEKSWEDFMTGKMQKDDVIILVLSSLDKRSKFYKTYNNSIVTFTSLNEAILKRYIAQKITLLDSNATKLIAVCENSYSRIMLEIDKIQKYGGNPDDAFSELMKQGVIYIPPQDAIFDFVSAVLKRNPKLAFNLLNQCYAIGESTIALLSVLYSNTKQVLQVQSCHSADVSKSTGLTGWQIKCAKEKCGYYEIGELVLMLKAIRNVEKGIKTGEIEDETAIPYLLTEVF